MWPTNAAKLLVCLRPRPETDSLRNTYLFVIVVVLLNTAGNTFLSVGMKAGGDSMLTSLMHPAVIAGIVLLIGWTLARMHLLSLADLSFVLPVTAVGYVFNSLIGHFLLGETVSAMRWSGTALIATGTVLTGLTLPSSRNQ